MVIVQSNSVCNRNKIGWPINHNYYNFQKKIYIYDKHLQLHCPITLSSYDFTEWLVKNKAANAPITFEEIVMVRIIVVFVFLIAIITTIVIIIIITIIIIIFITTYYVYQT